MKKIFFLLTGLVFLLSCGNRKSSLQSYYFPYADFFNPKIYKYINTKDTSQVQYWRFETGANNGDTVMSTGIYNQDLKLGVVYHNQITDEGSKLQQMMVNVPGSGMMIKADIKKTESFNWYLQPNTPWLLSFSIKTGDQFETQEIVSERMVETKRQQLSFNGQNYECLVIKESTMFNLITNNRTRSEEQQRTSYFAKGVGLVQYETFYANGTSELFRLDEIIVNEKNGMFTTDKKDTNSVTQ